MAYCSTCGSPKSTPFSFCSGCGSAPRTALSRVARASVQEAGSPSRFCRHCGSTIDGTCYCPACGASSTTQRAWRLRDALGGKRAEVGRAAQDAIRDLSAEAPVLHAHGRNSEIYTGLRRIFYSFADAMFAVRASVVFIALAAIVVSTGQGQELKLSLDTLEPGNVWLVFGATLYWALQTWLWSTIVLRLHFSVVPGLLPTRLQELFIDWLPLCLALVILTIGAWQFWAVGRSGLAFLIAATSFTLVALIRTWMHSAAAREAGPRNAVAKERSEASGIRAWPWGRRVVSVLKGIIAPLRLSRVLRYATAVSLISAVGLFAAGVAYPVELGAAFGTLGIVFLFLGIVVPAVSWLVTVLRNARIPVVTSFILAPFLFHACHALLVANWWIVLLLAAIAIFSKSIPSSVSAMIVVVSVLSAVSFWLPTKPHEVRKAETSATLQERCGDRSIDACKPAVREAIEAWDAERGLQLGEVSEAAGPPTSPSRKIVFVSAAGGGLRAAYWTASVLSRLDDCVSDFRKRVFSISGVSGGSLGALVYTSLSTHRPDAPVVRDDCIRQAERTGDQRLVAGKLQRRAQLLLSHDFLAPVASSMLFRDMLQSLSPVVFFPDRAVALEQGFERAWDEACAQEGQEACIGPNPLSSGFLVSEQGDWQPVLLLNGTHLETGKRLITSQISITTDVFLDALDFHAIAGFDVPSSTAVTNSARFPVVSPSGALVRDTENGRRHFGHVIDGGYFENNGAMTTLELARYVLCGGEDGCVAGREQTQAAFIDITNDVDAIESDEPEEAGPRELEQKRPFFPLDEREINAIDNQLLAPIHGLDHSRGAKGVHASRALSAFAKSIGAPYFRIRLCPRMNPPPQLGWLLSNDSRAAMDALLLGHTGETYAQQFGTGATTQSAGNDDYVRCSQGLARNIEELIGYLSK